MYPGRRSEKRKRAGRILTEGRYGRKMGRIAKGGRFLSIRHEWRRGTYLQGVNEVLGGGLVAAGPLNQLDAVDCNGAKLGFLA